LAIGHVTDMSEALPRALARQYLRCGPFYLVGLHCVDVPITTENFTNFDEAVECEFGRCVRTARDFQ
jgi:hypothetical protein